MKRRWVVMVVAACATAACGGATIAASSDFEPVDAGVDASDAGDAGVDARREAATKIPRVDETKCVEAGTLFECLDCCDLLYPPGTLIYRAEMDRCSCRSCPCEGSWICVEDGGGSTTRACSDCIDETREHDGPKSCHPSAEAECEQYGGCLAAHFCIDRSNCLGKPVK